MGEMTLAHDCFQLPPYPLEDKIADIFCELAAGTDFEPTGLDREFYLDLADRIVRYSLEWQDEHGAIISPVVGRETSTTTARFVGAVGVCAVRRCCDGTGSARL